MTIGYVVRRLGIFLLIVITAVTLNFFMPRVRSTNPIESRMNQLAAQGVAVLMISSDLEEILGMSDRVLVMHQGRLAGELSRSQLSEEAVMRLATGMNGVSR